MRPVLVFAFLFVVGLSLAALPLQAWQEPQEEDESQPLLPGLVATWSGLQGQYRFDQVLYSADAEVSPAGIEWKGYLQSIWPGKYRLAVSVRGEVQVRLGGQLILQTSSPTQRWIESEPIELDYDWHEIQISLRKTDANAPQLVLYWTGPGFPYEPVPAAQLFHDRQEATLDSTDAGRNLTRALRCDACHKILGLPSTALPSPSLANLNGHVKQAWLVSYLSAPYDDDSSEVRSTVATAFSKLHATMTVQEASDVATYLRSLSSPTQLIEFQRKGDLETGQRLFLSLGCLACHQFGKLGTDNGFGGGDLTDVATKRPSAFFSRWLRDPASINIDHRMPVFELTAEERASLTMFLASVRPSAASEPDPIPGGDVRRGNELVAQLHCAACHRIDDAPQPAKRTSLDPSSAWSNACLQAADSDHPGYDLAPSLVTTLRDFITAAHISMQNDLANNELMLRENNCLACHARNGTAGLLPVAKQVTQNHAEMAIELPALLPPSLNSVGDKLHREVLRQAISRQGEPLRHWLAVRMPRFPLEVEQVRQIADYFILCDRVPDAAHDVTKTRATPGVNVAERLVTADGFGCTSCHAIGKVKPRIAPLGALGPNLSMLGKRIRHTWFDRWVRNPARIVPKMEMPSVQIPVPGVLNEDLDTQLAAVWQVLNQPNFRPPDPHPVRIVRQSGMSAEPRAVVLTDVLKYRQQTFIKPFLIALPNRHNVLFDLSRGRLAGWWIGDTARQRTKGKAWYWDAVGEDVGTFDDGPDLVLTRDGKTFTPQRRGQFVTEPDAWTHIEGGGIELEHRLHFGTPVLATASVKQTITPLGQSSDANSGWRREILVSGLASTDWIRFNSSGATPRVTARLPTEAARRTDDAIIVSADASGNARLVLEYLTAKSIDAATPTKRPAGQLTIKDMDVVPGFHVTRLALSPKLMPTAIAWNPDGKLIVSSLKGRVWLAEDTDGDALEDSIRPISDELAAPYGLFATSDYIDVVNKYGVVRLVDTNGDDVVDRTTLVASGWGHTDDYHDWAVGLPRDQEGNYYVAIPCQQDNRSAEATRYRGTVLQLRPRDPDATDPRLFQLKRQSRGHRFPMGLARNRHGQLFVSDNQGNYNPFNELNHVTFDAHFGFINTLEKSPGFNPQLTPSAINIPHPWTRSVNGLCFLETPPELLASGRKHFGPFEGHLVGCEYDTRRLIRMSLDVVDGVVQGAAYPLSDYHAQSGDTFLGPLTCAVAPDGDVYIGNIRDSGWGGANNTGSVVRMIPEFDQLPTGIREIRVSVDGFHIDFTAPVATELAERIENYSVSSYRRISTPAYGGDDVDRRREKIDRVTLATDHRSVRIVLSGLRLGFVYEFRLKKLTNVGRFFPAEAFYTLHRLPR